jgi:ABC-2 type transport system ATP-binding protein
VKASTTLKLDVTTLRDKRVLDTIPGVEKFTSTDDLENNITSLRFVLNDDSAVSDIVSGVIRGGSKILALRKTEPTLEDVFIKLVGKGFE